MLAKFFRQAMLFKQTPKIGILAGLVAVGFIGGGLWWRTQLANQSQLNATSLAQILQAPPPERQTQLQQLVNHRDPLIQTQARYLLAVAALEAKNPNQALNWLKNLEQKSTPLTAPILVLQAQALTQANQTDAAQKTWQNLLSQFPDQPEAATALIALNQPEAAMAQFPQIPAVVELAQSQLRQEPENFSLLLLIARNGLFLPTYTQILDQLTQQYARQLQPEDWAAIGFGYWEKLSYKKAGLAYLNARATAFNLYRAGRALQLGGERERAMATYTQVLQQFPQTKEAALAGLRLGRLSRNHAQALTYLQTAITTANQVSQPTIAADALLDQAGLWEKMGNLAQASQARQTLLSQYSTTPAAAQLRWQQAQRDAQAQNFSEARTWAKAILNHNPDSELAPAAAFWLGHWTTAPRQRQQDWKILTEKYPFAYYTWRALSLQGKPVGTFSTLRRLEPAVDLHRRQILPLASGSPTLQALYDMGQYYQAWSRWQWEFQHRVQPTAAEQLTDGLIRLGVGDYLDGIFMLENLQQRARTEPETAAFFQPIQQNPAYWYALYPLPYWRQVQAWSNKRELNPLLVMALIRQESRFEVGIQSVVGATGLMQVMPETAAWIAPQIGLTSYQLDSIDDSLNLGTWYFAHTHDLHQQDTLLALASYNAGPGNVENWLNRFSYQDQDQFIEQIPFPETYGYIKSILANYWNYLRLYSNTNLN